MRRELAKTSHAGSLLAALVLATGCSRDGDAAVPAGAGDLVVSEGQLGPAPPPPPPLPDDVLFEADSRVYGFPFDETIREVSRRGNVSVIEHDISHGQGTGGALGRSLFAAGAVGELALRRGYDFYVILDDRSPGSTPGVRHEMTIGLTHEAEPDCAREFPNDRATKGCTTVRSDLGQQALGGWWPFGGVQPEPPPASAADAPR